MNELIFTLGLSEWKALLAPIFLPPTPFMALVLLAVALARRRPALGWALALLACSGLWATSSVVGAQWLAERLQANTLPLAADDLNRIKAAHQRGERWAVVVLGSGIQQFRSELGRPQLTGHSLARLRHGIWIGKATGVAVLYSGGASHLMPDGLKEAHVAERVAREEFQAPLRWVEDQARDTRENARFTVQMLNQNGVQHMVLVTHGWHMQRSLRAFADALKTSAAPITVQAAPMDVRDPSLGHSGLTYLPSGEGMALARQALREWLGWWAGA
jgi:uncharacterized SAM-binding protein YcdF (DUF218 family)